MSDEWLTYEQVAEQLNVTPRAARARAFRGQWSKMQGNDGRARVRLPDERPAPARNTTVRPTDPALVHALESNIKTLEAHVATLQEQLRVEAGRLAASEARADKSAADLARADKAIAAFSDIAMRLDALVAEREQKPWWRRVWR